MMSRNAVATTVFALGLSIWAMQAAGQEYPFNLVDGPKDENGFLLNPRWKAESPKVCPPSTAECSKSRQAKACAERASLDKAPGKFREWLRLKNIPKATCFLTRGPIAGHLNFQPVTFVGQLGWDGLAFDGDYDFTLQPEGGGVTLENIGEDGQPDIGVEFSSIETLNRADDLPEWWQGFRDVVLASRRPEPVREYIARENRGEPPLAVITGLLGLDCVHKCHSELHPVYGMAIRVRNELDGERWAVLARNWGNQGWCSQKQHPLEKADERGIEADHLSLFLPYPGASGVEVVRTNLRSYESRPQYVTRNPGEARVYKPTINDDGSGAYIRFDLPSSAKRTMIIGEIELKWTPAKVKRDKPPLFACKLPSVRRAQESSEPEDISRALEAAMTDGQLSRLRGRMLETARIEKTYSKELTLQEERPESGMIYTATGQRRVPVSVPVRAEREPERAKATKDKAKAAIDESLLRDLCALATSAKEDPDYQRLCKGQSPP